MPSKKVIICLALIGGISLMINGGYIQMKALLGQWLINNAWNQSEPSQQQKPWPWMDSWPVAKIEIPRLGIEQIVLEGDSGQSLAFGPGHRLSSAMPGERGTMLISGHRDTHFRFLQDLQPGDDISLVTADRVTHHYRVESMEILNAADWVISNPGEHRLILATCWPFNQLTATDQRYVVIARQRHILTVDDTPSRLGNTLG